MALILMMWMAPVKHSDACAEADTVVIRGVQGGWIEQLGETRGEPGLPTLAWRLY